MADRRSRWGQIADRVIAEVLPRCPAGATYQDWRDALTPAYPFGARLGTPYREWLKAIYRNIGRPGKQKERPTYHPAATVLSGIANAELSGLLVNLALTPADTLLRRAVFDRLEETGRPTNPDRPLVTGVEVARRLWPRCRIERRVYGRDENGEPYTEMMVSPPRGPSMSMTRLISLYEHEWSMPNTDVINAANAVRGCNLLRWVLEMEDAHAP